MIPDETLRACDQCNRTDLKGQVGLTMHKTRTHRGRNWSTRRKSEQGKRLIATGQPATE